VSFIERILSYPPCSAVAAGSTGSENELDQQLKIWKDLAITKQMIMNEAASALRLKGEWTQEELREALEAAIAKAKQADETVTKTRNESDQAIAEMQDKVRKSEKALSDALAKINTAEGDKEAAERQLENGRKDNSDALKKAKAQVEDKQRELKAINQALADTPENVVKKLKTLKRQKHEEATARTKAEDQNRKYKKQTKALEAKVETFDALREDSDALLKAYRELKESSTELLKKNEIDADELPKTDHELLGRLEKAVSNEEETEES